MAIDKKELIIHVNDVGKEIDKYNAIKDDEAKGGDKSGGVGTNQFRSLAAACKNCEVYEEIELLIKYKIAKSDAYKEWKTPNKRDNGTNQQNNGTIGTSVLSAIKKIREKYGNNGDDEELLNALSLFFGYLYQSARVWRSEIKKDTDRQSDKQSGHNKQNNSNKNNNNGYKNNKGKGGYKK